MLANGTTHIISYQLCFYCHFPIPTGIRGVTDNWLYIRCPRILRYQSHLHIFIINKDFLNWVQPNFFISDCNQSLPLHRELFQKVQSYPRKKYNHQRSLLHRRTRFYRRRLALNLNQYFNPRSSKRVYNISSLRIFSLQGRLVDIFINISPREIVSCQ